MMPRLIKSEVKMGTTPAELHELACAFSEEIFGRKGEAPFLFIIDTGAYLVWIECPWEDDREKTFHARFIAMLLRELQAKAYAFISEAWLATSKAETEEELPNSLADLPANERDDVLMVITQPAEGPALMARYLVTVRPRGVGPNFLGPRVDMNDLDGKFDGRLFDLFGKASSA